MGGWVIQDFWFDPNIQVEALSYKVLFRNNFVKNDFPSQANFFGNIDLKSLWGIAHSTTLRNSVQIWA